MPDLAAAELRDWGGVLLHCRQCDTPHPRQWFVIEWPDGRRYQPRFRCDDCRQPLTDLPERADGTLDEQRRYRCRKCGELTLTLDFDGCWD